MRKEQITHIVQSSNLQETLLLSDPLTSVQRTSKIDKKIRKKRSKNIKRNKTRSKNIMRNKTTASSQTIINSQASLNQVTQNTLLASSVRTASPLNISFQGFICSPIQVQDTDNFELVQTYQHLDTISEHLFEKQIKYPLPQLQYTIRFGSIQRVRLIQLIILSCRRLNLRLQTEFLAIDIFHRICTAAPFERYHSALKAASALYVAAKYEEVSAPQAHYISTLDPYQRILPENIVKLQGCILLHLDFNLSYAIPLNFVELLSIRYQLNTQQRFSLIQLCRRAVCKQQLCSSRGSLLSMACFSFLFGQQKQWYQNEYLRFQLEQRIVVLQQLWEQ